MSALLTDSNSFARRLKRIHATRYATKPDKRRDLERLLRLFGAEEVERQGVVIGYRLPSGAWFCRRRSYDTEVQAEAARKASGIAGGRQYRCPHCTHIHLSAERKKDKTK